MCVPKTDGETNTGTVYGHCTGTVRALYGHCTGTVKTCARMHTQKIFTSHAVLLAQILRAAPCIVQPIVRGFVVKMRIYYWKFIYFHTRADNPRLVP